MPTNTEAPERIWMMQEAAHHYVERDESHAIEYIRAPVTQDRTLIRYDLKYTEDSEGNLIDSVLEETEEGEFVKYADVAAPVPLAEEAIKDALAELRKMFPKTRCHISSKLYISGGFGVMDFDNDPKLYPHVSKREVEIWLMDVKPSNSELGVKIRETSLAGGYAKSERIEREARWLIHGRQRIEWKRRSWHALFMMPAYSKTR